MVPILVVLVLEITFLAYGLLLNEHPLKNKLGIVNLPCIFIFNSFKFISKLHFIDIGSICKLLNLLMSK